MLLKTNTNHYPFGSPMPSRSFSASSYRYGFNGKEKDDEMKGSGNSIDFGARMYDSRLGKFLSLDPLFKDYAPITPYSFALSNPIIFIDEGGNWVKGLDGKPVTYTKDDKGNISWSSNASEEAQRLGNSMMKTSKGTEILNNMRDANYPITVKINNETAVYYDEVAKKNVTEPNENTTPLFGETTPEYDKNHKLVGMTMTVNEKTVDELMKVEVNPMTGKKTGHGVMIDGEIVAAKDYTKEEIMGSVAVHEGTHTTDKGSYGEDKTKAQKEAKPEKNQSEHLKEIKEIKK